MTMYTISQLTAKLVRQERRVAVQYKGKTYVVEVASAEISTIWSTRLSDYTVTAVGHKQWGHSQPCLSVAECKDWIRTVHGADVEESERKSVEVQKVGQYEQDVAYVSYCSREEREVAFKVKGHGVAILARGQAADALFSKADAVCKRNNTLFTVDALLLAGMPLINARLLQWYPDVARELGVTTCRDAEPHTSQPVSKAASTQQPILPPGFRLQRTRKDAVHWHSLEYGVSRDFSTAAEAVEFAWLCWENVNK